MNNSQGYHQFRDEETQPAASPKENYQGFQQPQVQYDPLQIPPNWELARKHGLARRVANKIHGDKIDQEVCPCCQYAVFREDISVFDSSKKLSFLGSGFPLFFNFVKYSIFLCLTLLIGTSILGLYQNSQGNFCKYTLEQYKTALNDGENVKHMCVNDGVTRWTLVNQEMESAQQSTEYEEYKFYCQFITVFACMGLLIMFRRSQYRINLQCDKDNLTPSDFTLRVFNIPVYDEVKLRKCFEDTMEGVKVAKVTFCFNSSPITKIQNEIKEIVKKKQQYFLQNNTLLKHNIQQDPQVQQLDQQINDKKAQKQRIIQQQILSNQEKHFLKVAFVSFQTEQQKNQVLEEYNSLLSSKKFEIDGQKIELMQAAEPTDIIWGGINFVHNTSAKIIARTKSWIQWALMVAFCFICITGLSFTQKKIVKSMSTGSTTTQFGQFLVNIVTLAIPVFINIFNKFFFGPFLKDISVAKELWGTKTKLMIAFSFKLALGGFINMVFLVIASDIYFFENIYQPGGFIYTTDKMFYMNAFVTIMIYIIDPWFVDKSIKLNKELKKSVSVLTQQEANELMEYPPYGIARRYSDTLKTVWMTFFLESLMPFGVIYSIIGLVCLYWIDKYNVVNKRTIKDSIDMELSTSMIDLLEMIIIAQVGGAFYFNYIVLGKRDIEYIVLAIIGIIYSCLPLEKIVKKNFKLKSDDVEEGNYEDVEHLFETDYDRENPVLKDQSQQKYLNSEKVKNLALKTLKATY